MRKGIVAAALAVAVLGPSTAAFAAPASDPPRGPCNRGTMNAHATVPYATEGNHQAHSTIPHCEH